MQEVGCEHPIEDGKLPGTQLLAVEQVRFDGNAALLLDFDDRDRMLSSVLLGDQVQLMRNLLGKLGDGTLAVGLDDAVGKAALHREGLRR